MRLQRIEHHFVEFIPEKLEPGKLYISIEYATATHLCACGCEYEVSNPITPTDWSLTYNGETVSLSPSIGNSNFPCKSHYWLRGNRVVWEQKMTPQLTELSRARDKSAKGRRFGAPTHQLQVAAKSQDASAPASAAPELPKSVTHGGDSWLTKLKKLFS